MRNIIKNQSILQKKKNLAQQHQLLLFKLTLKK
uniref:Uncharacterized protein n=1 Tax=Anguilla anguilla TaxID=7936 RepID=A0A0E9R7V7_ANGAN